MNKDFLKELILPSFWLFFFVVSSKNEDTIRFKNERDIAFKKKQDVSGAEVTHNAINKNKEVGFIKAVYLAGF